MELTGISDGLEDVLRIGVDKIGAESKGIFSNDSYAVLSVENSRVDRWKIEAVELRHQWNDTGEIVEYTAVGATILLLEEILKFALGSDDGLELVEYLASDDIAELIDEELGAGNESGFGALS